MIFRVRFPDLEDAAVFIMWCAEVGLPEPVNVTDFDVTILEVRADDDPATFLQLWDGHVVSFGV